MRSCLMEISEAVSMLCQAILWEGKELQQHANRMLATDLAKMCIIWECVHSNSFDLEMI